MDFSYSFSFSDDEEIGRPIEEINNSIKEMGYPIDSVTFVQLNESDVIISFCQELGHYTSYHTLEHVYDKICCLKFANAGDMDPLNWDPYRVLKCPCYYSDGEQCGRFFPLDDILNQIPSELRAEISEKIENKFERLLREHFRKLNPKTVDCISKHCYAHGVSGIGFQIPKELHRHREFKDNDLKNIYQCQTCGITWCIKCGCQYFTETMPEDEQKLSHDGHSCEIMKQLKMGIDPSIKMLEENSRKCPNCGVHIHVYSGCNRIKCSKCGTNFCWICLKQYKDSRKVYQHIEKFHPGLLRKRPERGVIS